MGPIAEKSTHPTVLLATTWTNDRFLVSSVILLPPGGPSMHEYFHPGIARTEVLPLLALFSSARKMVLFATSAKTASDTEQTKHGNIEGDRQMLTNCTTIRMFSISQDSQSTEVLLPPGQIT